MALPISSHNHGHHFNPLDLDFISQMGILYRDLINIRNDDYKALDIL